MAGCYSVDGDPPVGELGNMWIRPSKIGTGLGRVLWQDAMATHGRPGASGSCVLPTSHAHQMLVTAAPWSSPWLPEGTDKTIGKLLSRYEGSPVQFCCRGQQLTNRIGFCEGLPVAGSRR